MAPSAGLFDTGTLAALGNNLPEKIELSGNKADSNAIGGGFDFGEPSQPGTEVAFDNQFAGLDLNN